MLRATGLKNTTSSYNLDKVLGTNLRTFAEHSIILTGLKIHRDKPDFFDRSDKIRKRFATGSYSNSFIRIWNKLPDKMRKEILSMPKLESVKSYLKNERKLEYSPQIHIDNKWIDYNEL